MHRCKTSYEVGCVLYIKKDVCNTVTNCILR